MKKHNFSWKSLILALISGLLLGSAVTFIFISVKINNTQNAGGDLTEVSQVYQTIRKNYYRKVSSKTLVNGAINGMIKSLNDPYSEYLTDKDQTDFNSSITGKISGIGATIEKDNDSIKIVSVMPKSPAAKNGLKPKDLIKKINNKSTKSMTVSEASSLTRGKEGTKVTLTIQRGTDIFQKELTREPIKVSTVYSKLDKNNHEIGYITITQFSDHTASELKKNIKLLKQKGAKKLIVDVRNNPGGVMDQAISASSMFVKNGRKIMTITSKKDGSKTYYANKKYQNNYKANLPTVVLVDGGTASAAEIFSGALNQSAGIPLIGEKTFGKGVVQTLSPLTADSEMKITTAKWLTPNGSWINKKGIKPTIEVKYPAYMSIKPFKGTKTLTAGVTDGDVKIAQQMLTGLGLKTNPNGVLDTATSNNLKKFQVAHKLSVTGNLDKQTRVVLIQELAKKARSNDTMYNKAVSVLNGEK